MSTFLSVHAHYSSLKAVPLYSLVGSPRMVWLWLAGCFFPLPQPLFLAEVFATEV